MWGCVEMRRDGGPNCCRMARVNNKRPSSREYLAAIYSTESDFNLVIYIRSSGGGGVYFIPKGFLVT